MRPNIDEPVPRKKYVEGMVVVRFNDSMSEEAILQLLQSLNLSKKDHIARRRVYLVAVPIGEEKDWVGKFKAMKNDVESVCLEYIYKIC